MLGSLKKPKEQPAKNKCMQNLKPKTAETFLNLLLDLSYCEIEIVISL
jgi:hypothetical protein